MVTGTKMLIIMSAKMTTGEVSQEFDQYTTAAACHMPL
jgi:hypothetical protein